MPWILVLQLAILLLLVTLALCFLQFNRTQDQLKIMDLHHEQEKDYQDYLGRLAR